MADYDEFTKDALMQSGLPYRADATRLRSDKKLPYNTAGLPGLLVRDMPALEGTNARGLMIADNRISKLPANRVAQKNIFVKPSAPNETVAHEAEHLLARQALGHPAKINEKFDELSGDWKNTGTFVKAALAAGPYLKQKYGLDNAYFDPDYLKNGGTYNVLYEQLASLAGVEAAQGVDLTKDPVLRKTLFKDKAVRETYNAITGLRQTRLDARDLPPYTRQPEPADKNAGAVDKLKKLLGFANGGAVSAAGRTKLI